MGDWEKDEFKISRRMLKVMTVDTRVDILKALERRPMTASELSRYLKKHVTTVTFHLDVLTENGLTERVERAGRKWVYYKITKPGKKILHPQPYTKIILMFGITVIAITGVYLISIYYDLIFPPPPTTVVSFEEALGGIEDLGVGGIDIPTEVEIEVEEFSEETVNLIL